MITNEQLEEIKLYIQGSCNTLDEAVRTCTDEEYGEEDLNEEQIKDIESEHKLCDNCGWWNEIIEFSEEDDICNDCLGSMDEEM